MPKKNLKRARTHARKRPAKHAARRARKTTQPTATAPGFVTPFYKLGDVWPGKGGRFAGIGIAADGSMHRLFVHEARTEKKNFADVGIWAKTLEADGHKDFRPMTLKEGALAYATMKDHFERDWHWTGEEHAGYSYYAWFQSFINGGQDCNHRDNRCCARAVRSEPI